MPLGHPKCSQFYIRVYKKAHPFGDANFFCSFFFISYLNSLKKERKSVRKMGQIFSGLIFFWKMCYFFETFFLEILSFYYFWGIYPKTFGDFVTNKLLQL